MQQQLLNRFGRPAEPGQEGGEEADDQADQEAQEAVQVVRGREEDGLPIAERQKQLGDSIPDRIIHSSRGLECKTLATFSFFHICMASKPADRLFTATMFVKLVHWRISRL